MLQDIITAQTDAMLSRRRFLGVLGGALATTQLKGETGFALGGVVEAASYRDDLVEGGLTAGFGNFGPDIPANGLFPTNDVANEGLPTELGGIRISDGEQYLPLFYIFPNQTAFQLPFRSGQYQLFV